MFVLVTYDVSVTTPGGAKRLRKVAKYCQNMGQRVQNSVFECIIEPAQYVKMKIELSAIIDKKTDSLRFYQLGSKWERKVEHVGAKAVLELEKGTLIL